MFAAHVGNWELPAIAARMYGLDTTVLYRRPNLKAVSDEVVALRAGCMGTLLPTTMDAPVKRDSHLVILRGNLAPDGAVAKIFAAKGRPSDHPLIVHVADIAELLDNI